jgi:hypothetical protein
MISTSTLKLVVDQVERMLCCDEANRTEKDHLSFALAHLREAGGLESRDDVDVQILGEVRLGAESRGGSQGGS